MFKIIPLAGFALLFGCGAEDLCTYTEQQRISSTDNIVDAVLLKQECGATVADVFKVFLTKKGKKIEMQKENPVFISDHTKNIKISWSSKKNLNIKYSEARIFQFRNFWHSKKIDNFDYIVDILEIKTR